MADFTSFPPVLEYDPNMLEFQTNQLPGLNYHQISHYDNNNNNLYYNQLSLIHSSIINGAGTVDMVHQQGGGNHRQISPERERLVLDNQIQVAANIHEEEQQRKRKLEEEGYHVENNSSSETGNSSYQSPHSVSKNIVQGSSSRPKTVSSAGRSGKRGKSSIAITTTSRSTSSTTKREMMTNMKPEAEEEGTIGDVDVREVVHVRAKRGQATDSHSLAERVRRGKINEKMKCLQEMVPGCSYSNSNSNKTMGMAVVLDEIINYVQSLQNQVEFLSMKLAAASVIQEYHSTSTSTTSLTNYASPDSTITMPKMDEKLESIRQHQPKEDEEAEMGELLNYHNQQLQQQQQYLQPFSWTTDHRHHQSTWP